ncbi:MAG: hypothetical protein WD552_02110 [Candidatus Paceibacterota bacterium]
MTIMKQHFRPVRVPEDGVEDNWLSQQVKQYFKDELKEYYDLQDGVELKDVEVDRCNKKLESNSNLSLLIGFDKKEKKLEAQFLNNSCFAARVKATVVFN